MTFIFVIIGIASFAAIGYRFATRAASKELAAYKAE